MTTLNVITFPKLLAKTIRHGCFTRHGGRSSGIWASLNCSLDCGDDPDNVHNNKEIIRYYLGLDKLITCQQVHGDEVLLVDEQTKPGQQADAMVSAVSGLGLLIQQADCQAVLLYDPQQKVVANIHVGWRGDVNNIIAKTIMAMTKIYSCQPHHLLAGISPSLGPCCAEFINYQQEFPAEFQPFQIKPFYFDLWQLSSWQLTQTGVKPENIHPAQICTCCNLDFFSYRRQHKTGRCASVIGLCHG